MGRKIKPCIASQSHAWKQINFKEENRYLISVLTRGSITLEELESVNTVHGVGGEHHLILSQGKYTYSKPTGL